MSYIKRPCDRCGRTNNLYKTKIAETDAGIKIFKTLCWHCKLKTTGTRAIKNLSRLKEAKLEI